MDSIAGTGLETERTTDTHPPSLLVIVLDTNPYAWNDLSPNLTLSRAVSDLLVFINAHLAFNHANRIAVLASHCQRTAWLYPSSPLDLLLSSTSEPSNPNKYRPFALIEHELLSNLRSLLSQTKEADLLSSPTSTTLAGSLTLALSYISKISSSPVTAPTYSSIALDSTPTTSTANARILIVSTSGDLATQYIPLMNVIFAAQHLRVPLDILKLAGDSVLLQQASFTTSGIFLAPISQPVTEAETGDHPTLLSLLPTLLFAFLSDPYTRTHLMAPTAINVDFRAACFCHRRVVDIGYVCSICLSIFCEEGVAKYMQGQEGGMRTVDGLALSRDGAKCLTCGTMLSLRVLGGVGEAAGDDRPRKKKKKKRREEGEAGTPVPG